jgi:hypothetical protein
MPLSGIVIQFILVFQNQSADDQQQLHEQDYSTITLRCIRITAGMLELTDSYQPM